MDAERRVATGIIGLDQMLSGGLLDSSCTLVAGPPGVGKTTLALQFVVHGAGQLGEPGLWISFEEFPRSLYRQATSLGWYLPPLEEQGKLDLLFTSPEVLLASLESLESPLIQRVENQGTRRVVIDSLTHFTRLTSAPHDLRRLYNTIVNGLKRLGVTSILLGEDSHVTGGALEQGRLAYIADTVVLLRHIEIDSSLQRAMLILKMRGSDHAKEIRRFEIADGGLMVGDLFAGREGVLSGAPWRRGPDH